MRHAVFLFLLGLLAACGGQPASDPDVLPPIIPATTKVTDAATREALATYDPATGTMRFSGSTPILAELAPDDVLASEPSPAAPYGYLRRVKVIRREGGGIVLETTQANLTDAISQGSLRAAANLTADDMLRTEALPGVTVTATASAPPALRRKALGVGESFGFRARFNHVFVPLSGPNARGQITVDGEVGFNAGYGVNVDVSACFDVPPVCVEGFEAKVGFDQGTRLSVTGDFSGQVGESVKVATQYFKPHVFFIGPFPVVIVPSVDLYLSAGGEVTAQFSFSASQSARAQLGARWTEDGGWRDLSGFDFGGQVEPPTFTGSLKPRAAVRSSASLKLYGVAGPEASLEGGLELDGKIPRNPTWIMGGFLKGTLGFVVDLPIVGKLADYHTTRCRRPLAGC